MLSVLYLVHDLSDPAVRRRIMMLQAGGAKVVLAGFCRGGSTPREVAGCVPVDLGATRDGAFGQRLLALARAFANVRSLLGGVAKPDLILARNLEMLALAERARSVLGGETIPIVYECLDIHRLMLRDDAVGATLRAVERRLARRVPLLLTSSPAFVENYFRPHARIDAPILLLENKFFDPRDEPVPRADISAGPPWRIGWFGALRCRRSLDLLASFTRRTEGLFEVVMRGRPALAELPNFHAFVAAEPFLSFGGPYRNPEDMASVYGGVHFAWTADFFEAGQNSSWLLPNRLYEGCRFGAVPVAVAGTETARFLAANGIGVTLPSQPDAGSLIAALGGIDGPAFGNLRAAVARHDASKWACGAADCRKLVEALARIAADSSKPAKAAAMLALEPEA